MGDDTKVDLKTAPPESDVIISSPPESQSANESEGKEPANQNPDDEASEAVNWWSGWGNTTKWAKTITDASSNLTKSVSYGLELANQVLDKEIEIEIDVDKVTEQVSNLATKTVTQSKKIIEKSSGVVDESLKYVEAGVNLVSEDVQELSQAIREDTQASYTALTTATYSTIEKVGGESTANTAVKMKDSIFGGINAFASVILADSTDSEDEELKKRKILKGPEARLNQLRISPATYCNEPEDMSDFLRWLIDFDLESDKTKAEMSDLLVETPQVRSLYSKLVPEAVTHSDFWQRYYYRLHTFNEAEMRRSRLVERANTEDEDEELDSWGSDTDSEADPKDNLEDNLQAKPEEKLEDKKSLSEDIGPDGPEDKKIESSSVSELPVQDATGSEPEVTGTVTPQSSESKESEWTNVDKSESDDWEQEFDEINETKKEKKETKEEIQIQEEETETGDDWDDWS